jgi:hypothetical protein
MKLRLMRAHPTVCFQVDHIEDISNWQSVITWGTFEELYGDDAANATALIVSRFTPLLGGAPIQRAHGMGGWGSHPPTWHDAVLYRITLTTKTGRVAPQGTVDGHNGRSLGVPLAVLPSARPREGPQTARFDRSLAADRGYGGVRG